MLLTKDAHNVDIDQLSQLDASDLLRYAFETYGLRAAIGTSLQKTGVVAIDLANKSGVPYRVFFIDTLKNNSETYEFRDQVERHYGITIENFAPTDEEVHELYSEFGTYAHFFSRTQCCHTRKNLPLRRAMKTMDCWLAGLRSDQSQFRKDQGKKVSWAYDTDSRPVLKINPLLDWTTEQIDEYTSRNGIPYNKLYDYESSYGERYTVIGCEPCHVPVMIDLDPRAGKFPWEQSKKECGLHQDGSGI